MARVENPGFPNNFLARLRRLKLLGRPATDRRGTTAWSALPGGAEKREMRPKKPGGEDLKTLP